MRSMSFYLRYALRVSSREWSGDGQAAMAICSKFVEAGLDKTARHVGSLWVEAG